MLDGKAGANNAIPDNENGLLEPNEDAGAMVKDVLAIQMLLDDFACHGDHAMHVADQCKQEYVHYSAVLMRDFTASSKSDFAFWFSLVM